MIKQTINKCNLVLAPATDEEKMRFINSLYSLYVLYINKDTKNIEIGIPGMENHTSLHNMDNFEESEYKAYFLNLGYAGMDVADIITDRPVYMIESTEQRTVSECTLVNGIKVELNDVLNGNFVIGKNKQKIKR